MRFDFFQNIFLRERFLVATLGVFGDAVEPLLHRFQIGENQFRRDSFYVAHWLNTARDMMDVCVFKATHYLNDGIHFTDVGQKFIAQPFALRRAFDETGYVHEFNRRWNDNVRPGNFLQNVKPFVRHGDDADVWVNGAKGIVRGLGLARAREGVEQG